MNQLSRCFYIFILMGLFCNAAYPARQYVVTSPGISVKLSSEGEVTSVALGAGGIKRQVLGQTVIEACTVEGPTEATKLGNGGMRFEKHMTCLDRGSHYLLLVEEFIPTQQSIQWKIQLDGKGPSWTTAIETRLKWLDVQGAQFWTTWGDDSPETAGANEGLIISETNPAQESIVDFFEHRWRDPLVPRAFRNTELWNGGHPYLEGGFAIPIATVIEKDNDIGLSPALSPRDTTIDLNLETTSEGLITFSRFYNRLGGDTSVRFSVDLIGHRADWRPALG